MKSHRKQQLFECLATAALILLISTVALALIWLVGAFIAWDLHWFGWLGFRIIFVFFCGLILISMMLKEAQEDEGTASGPKSPPPPKPRK